MFKKTYLLSVIVFCTFITILLCSCNQQSNVPVKENGNGYTQENFQLLIEKQALEKENQDLKDEIKKKQKEIDKLVNETQYLNDLCHLLRAEPKVTKKTGYIKEIREDNGKLYILFDEASFLANDEAIKAIMEDKKVDKKQAEDEMPNGFYIRNKDTELCKYTLNNDVPIYIFSEQKACHIRISYDDFLKMHGETGSHTYKLFFIYIKANKVEFVAEQYLP